MSREEAAARALAKLLKGSERYWRDWLPAARVALAAADEKGES